MLGNHKPVLGSAPLPKSALLSEAAGGAPREARAWTRFDRWWLLLIGAVALACLLYFGFPERYAPIFRFVIGSVANGKPAELSLRYLGEVLTLSDGVWMTLSLTVISFTFILITGMIMGVCRVSSIGILRSISSLYVEVVRGVPVLVWLLWIYFGLPVLLHSVPALVDAKIPDYTAAVVAFTFAYGAYMTEVFRAGIQSIAKGQMEASRSLGMNYIQAMRYVILPQAVRVILPPVSNEFVTLLKDSALVSILGLPDLTRRGREWVGRYFTSFDTYFVVALTYLILTLFFTRITSGIERRLAVEKR